ncbi:GTPase family protein [Citrobacter braakii]|uniref:GTPase family protein n=1 Tax=Citrobacter braakii TaxID=57706 RepID=UPI0039783677
MRNQEGLQSLQNSLTGLPKWASERVMQQIRQLTNYEPFIGIMGKTGSGKSSLCNALFAGEVSPVNDVSACTREPLRFRLQVGERCMTLVDLPGVGESEKRDAEYAALYRQQLPKLDLVLWLIKADDRALAVDEQFYHQIIGEQYRHRVLFVISQADKIEPTDTLGGGLSTTQKRSISRKIVALHELFQPVHPVCAVSVRTKWGLRLMAQRMVRSLPREASSPVVAQLQCPFRTEQVKEKARSDIGETVGAALDMVCNVPLIEVYINNRKAGTFSPDVQNAQKVLPTLADCTND